MKKNKKIKNSGKRVKAVIYREEFYPFYYIEGIEPDEKEVPEGHGHIIEMPEDNYDEVMMFQNAFVALQEQMGAFYEEQEKAYEIYKKGLGRKSKKGKKKTSCCKKCK